MANGNHSLIGETGTQEVEKLAGPLLQMLQRLYIVGPDHVFQVGNILSREFAPVAFAQQWSSHNGFMMRFGDNLSCLDRPVQVAGNEGVDSLLSQLIAHLFSLNDTCFVELTLYLPLQNFLCIVIGLAMTY